MEDEIWVTYRADHRAVVTNSADPDLLAQVIADWPVPSALADGASQLWQRACGQFRSGSLAYENFTDAVRTGFEAIDSALRHHVSDLVPDGKWITMGPLVERANKGGRLTKCQHEWLTHANRSTPLVLSPPLSAEMMEGIACFLAELVGTSPLAP